jgi:hypothetical protein
LCLPYMLLLLPCFRISGDWSFDEAMAGYPCEVHSFDPRWVDFSDVCRDCLYSFAIGQLFRVRNLKYSENDRIFDNSLLTVNMFVCSIGRKDHLHSPGVHFHNVGLWGSDFVNENGWSLKRLETIRRLLGHDTVNWSVCPEMSN